MADKEHEYLPKGDWLKVYRDMLDHPVMQDDWLCRLWIWCLLSANYTTGEYKGQPVKRGSFVTGRISGSQQLNVSPSKFYRGLEKLTELECITVKANSNWTTVTVCNYTTYQDKRDSKRTAKEQPADSKRTAGDTTSGQPADTIEEGKKERREELNTMGSSETKKTEIEKPEPISPVVPAHAILDDAFRSTFKPLALVPLPDVLETPAFRETWGKWCFYMTSPNEKGLRYAQATMQAHLIDLSRDGPTTAAERLIEAMASGSIYPAKRKQDKAANGKQQQPDWLAKARANNASKTK